MLENMITDRTEADIEEVRAVAEAIKNGTASYDQMEQYRNGSMRGAYSYIDLNRVENAVDYVAKELQKYGYMRRLPIVRQWNIDSKFNEADLSRYIQNVATIRKTLSVFDSTPMTPPVGSLDIHQANALEQILVDVEVILEYMKKGWFYSGDLYSAEV